MQSAIRGGTFTFFVAGGGGGRGGGVGQFPRARVGVQRGFRGGRGYAPSFVLDFFFCKRVSDGTSSGTGCALTATGRIKVGR